MNAKAKFDTMAVENFREYLKVTEVAKFLGVSKHHVYSLMADYGLPYIKLGRSYRIPKRGFIEFLELLNAQK